MKSFTTDVIFTTLQMNKQAEFVRDMLKLRNKMGVDVVKAFDEFITHKPYSLITAFAIITNYTDFTVAKENAVPESVHLTPL